MPERRSYDDPCGIARALDVIGERWALLVVRELLLGPKRFSDLVRGLPGTSQNVLSQRLRDLVDAQVVGRRRLGPPVSAQVYELTERGRALRPVVVELGRWGGRIAAGTSGELSPDAFAIALLTTFAGAPDSRIELRIDDDVIGVTITDGQVDVARGAPDRPDAVLTGPVAALRGVVFGGAPLAELDVTGDRTAAERFVRAFPRPVPFAT
ncbi:winged helix-turn-helix transcriptional regulator [Pseudonocardia sp. CA-107938]|uniref:winged helix-turn-helix transcriptional regulator n=1 Tax=Pseudonocardia sp. CA-107938 TaxID=3240021 RepID=UPI003D8A4BDF